MRTAYISHRDCHLHDTGEGHPENSRRLYAIEDQFVATGLNDVLSYYDAPDVTPDQLLRVHTPEHLELMERMIPGEGFARLDPDTIVSSGSLTAARRAAGAGILAVDLLMSGEMETAFCGVRPPGHHAESSQAMGFCLFNNVAIAAAHALETYGLRKVAVVDFDVHQGNGTEEIFKDDERVLVCSTFQHPFFPYSVIPENNEHMVSIPLDATAGSDEFRAAISEHWLPALESFQPEFVFVSAGFDAHIADDMSDIGLVDADFRWVAEHIVRLAGLSASGRIVSFLEGGYELRSLARCVETHIRILMGLN